MSLDFLTPATEGAPEARGPLADAAEAAGAVLESRAGWFVAGHFGDPEAETAAIAETVGFADRSHLTKLELQGAVTALNGALGPAAEDPAGSSLGLARLSDGVWRCPLTPSRALLLAEPEQRAEALQTGQGEGLACCDVSAAWGALSIAGPRARDLIARFCALDLRASVLPEQGFRPGSIARTPGFLLRESESSFLLLFGAAYGAYLWEVVADAAAPLGGRPVGLEALSAREATHA